MVTKEQFIVDVWERIDADVVSAAELSQIQNAISERFGNEAGVSPALIARVLADHGARLGHPEVIQTDSRWREQHLFWCFTADDLSFVNMENAAVLIEKIQRLQSQFDNDGAKLVRLRLAVQKLKAELDLIASSERAGRQRRDLAREVSQWLAVWLQNSSIFTEWLALRRATPDFQTRFC